MDKGWVHIWRRITESSVWAEPEPYDFRAAWIWMILRAAYRAHTVRLFGMTIALERGQFATSERILSEQFKWHRNRVRRFLEMLEADGCIHRAVCKGPRLGPPLGPEKGQRLSIITICKYSAYNDVGSDLGPSTGPSTGTIQDHLGTTIREGKEEEEKRRVFSGPVPAKPETAPAPDWEGVIAEKIMRYSNRALVTDVLDAFALTRRTGKIAPAILARELAKWEKFPPDHVEKMAAVYMERHTDKPEAYFAAMLRNEWSKTLRGPVDARTGQPKVSVTRFEDFTWSPTFIEWMLKRRSVLKGMSVHDARIEISDAHERIGGEPLNGRRLETVLEKLEIRNG